MEARELAEESPVTLQRPAGRVVVVVGLVGQGLGEVTAVEGELHGVVVANLAPGGLPVLDRVGLTTVDVPTVGAVVDDVPVEDHLHRAVVDEDRYAAPVVLTEEVPVVVVDNAYTHVYSS